MLGSGGFAAALARADSIHITVSPRHLRPLLSVASVVASILMAAPLGGCAGTSGAMFPESKWGAASVRVVGADEPVPKGGGEYKIGAPYQVAGTWYNPREQPGYDRIGVASWYGSDFHGRRTANGEIYDMHALSAAHPTLPMPSLVYVTNLANARTILVRVNDRGPYVGGRIIDLSRASARALDLHKGGTGKVRVTYAGPAPLDGNDSKERQFLASQPWNGGRTRYAGAREQASPYLPPQQASYERARLEARPVSPPPIERSQRWAQADDTDAPPGDAWTARDYRASLTAR